MPTNAPIFVPLVNACMFVWVCPVDFGSEACNIVCRHIRHGLLAGDNIKHVSWKPMIGRCEG